MMRRFRKTSQRLPLSIRLWAWAGMVVLGSWGSPGCKKSDGGSGDDLGPAALVFLDAQNSSGETFEAGSSEVVVSCDQLVTFRFGPQEDADDILDNWIMRPAGLCNTQAQCGFIHLRVLDSSGATLLQERSASVNVVVDLAEVDLSRVDSVTGVLTEGETGEPYVQRGEIVSTTWELAVSQGHCVPTNLGGMNMGGADPGMGPPPGGTAGMGGAL
jgi:hypothetical protein